MVPLPPVPDTIFLNAADTGDSTGRALLPEPTKPSSLDRVRGIADAARAAGFGVVRLSRPTLDDVVRVVASIESGA